MKDICDIASKMAVDIRAGDVGLCSEVPRARKLLQELQSKRASGVELSSVEKDAVVFLETLMSEI